MALSRFWLQRRSQQIDAGHTNAGGDWRQRLSARETSTATQGGTSYRQGFENACELEAF